MQKMERKTKPCLHIWWYAVQEVPCCSLRTPTRVQQEDRPHDGQQRLRLRWLWWWTPFVRVQCVCRDGGRDPLLRRSCCFTIYNLLTPSTNTDNQANKETNKQTRRTYKSIHRGAIFTTTQAKNHEWKRETPISNLILPILIILNSFFICRYRSDFSLLQDAFSDFISDERFREGLTTAINLHSKIL
jgi:hypothetical protein